MAPVREPDISVIIPVHNGGEKFRLCLESVQKAITLPAEVIVVADGETDGSWRMAEQLGMRVIRLPETGGPARARNAGARTAKGDILFFVDADVTIPPDALNQINRAFQGDAGLAAVLGSYDDAPYETNFFSQYKNLLHHYVHQTASEQASTFWGACGAIRAEIFWAVGGFDETYRRPSIEDIELGYRVRKAGHRIRLLKALQIKHLKWWGFISLSKTDLFCRAFPWSRLILKENPIINDLNLKMSHRFSGMLIWVGVLSAGAAFYTGWALVAILGVIVAMLALNWDLYRYLSSKRGVLFALKAVSCHWFYYLYSTAAFGLVWGHRQLSKIGSLFRTHTMAVK
ncbi:glycosyltransferase, group 2 family protein [delta proteobacterium NaphS2]|nr:glycosyltransferase, group 2 family protein [delta proteobacterium NaphS2]